MSTNDLPGAPTPGPVDPLGRFVQIKGLEWQRRWETMMNAYNPWRTTCFDRLLRWPAVADEAPIRILDLGCGPGSLSFAARRRFPRAELWAVDFDPVLLELARRENQAVGAGIHFLQADLRRADVWADLPGRFDLVISAIALHWLGSAQLAELYGRVGRAMAPGGWFLNGDHLAAVDPAIQERFNDLRQQRQQPARSQSRACTWDEFWETMRKELPEVDLAALRRADDYWDGTDDGYPWSFHEPALRHAGFDPVFVLWQDEGDGLIAARK